MLSFFFFSSRRRHTRCLSDWSSDVCSSDLMSFCRRPAETHSLVPDTSPSSASKRRNPAGMTPLRTGDGFPNVVVTAVAATTSLAPDAEQTWQLLLEGRSGIRKLDFPFLAEFDSPVRIGGPLHEKFDVQLA